MNKIVITGATSMIGVALIEAAVLKDCEVYAIVRPHTNRLYRIMSSPKVHILYGLLENLKEIKGLPSDCEVFYHFAWAGTTKVQRDDSWIQENNIRNTLDAVEVARKCGCKTFIGAGSQAEYGPNSKAIDTSTKFNPVTSYGAAKMAANFLSRKLCDRYRITHIWGRIFSVYGKYDNEGTMLIYAIDQFLKRKSAYFSSGLQKWNYLNERDVGEIFYLLGKMANKSGEYCIASNQSRLLRDYIMDVANLMDAKDLCNFALDEDNSELYSLDVVDNKLFEEIGYWPKVDFRTGIKEIIEERKKELE